MQPFLEALAERALVCDGAMGTVLYSRGVFLNRCFDELNLSQPDLVAAIHRDYVRAGADVIETNTFGANRPKLAVFGLSDQVAAINRQGAEIARRAALGGAWVAGAIGPLGVRIEPWGRMPVREAAEVFREQAAALDAGGVDLLLFETFRDFNELATAVSAVRAISRLPIVAQMMTGEDGNSLDGTPPEIFTPALERAGADVIGLNCSVGPAAMLETIETMARLTAAPLSAQPNAGRPREVDGRNLYLSSPEYMASYARRFVAAGVRLVGGCCGTTPDHTRQMAQAVRTMTPAARPAPVVAAGAAEPLPPVPHRDKSGLARALADGRFVLVAEVAAPRGFDLSASVVQGRRFADLGATAVNVPDDPTSSARPSALATAVALEQGQVETILHFTCRDRTLLAMQSDLVGAQAMGVRNLLITTGRPLQSGTYPDATSVFEVDAIGLLELVAQLNRGLDLGGKPLGAAAALHAGAAVNPLAADPDAEWRRLERKVEAGAEFLVTPPVLDPDAFLAVLPRIAATGLPVLAGVAVLAGLRHAEFLSCEVTGTRVAERFFERLRAAFDEAAEALAITHEIVSSLRPHVQGLLITAFHGSPGSAERLIADLAVTHAGESRRP